MASPLQIERASRFPRRWNTNPMWSRTCWFAVCVIGVVAIAAAAPAPINGRFQVFRTGNGYELRGYRAEVGDASRFILTADMSAAEAREQMLSVRWEWSEGLADPRARRLQAGRTLYGAGRVTEEVVVLLDPTRRFVETVAYTREPAHYSRFGLDYYLQAAFQEGQVLASSQDRLLVEYGPRSDQVLRVEAARLPREQTQWHLVFRMDLVSAAREGSDSEAAE